jgi:two-component system CheB/CheR fusion protein
MNRSILLPELDHLLQHVIDDLTFVDREVQDRNGHWYSLRLRPYRTRENKIDGVVLLLVDIDEHKQAMQEIMDLVRQPLVALSAGLRVNGANTAFYQTFGLQPKDAENCPVYELGNGEWNNAPMRTLLEDLLPKEKQIKNYKVQINLGQSGQQTILLNAREFYEEGKGRPLILLSIEEVTRKAGGGGRSVK